MADDHNRWHGLLLARGVRGRLLLPPSCVQLWTQRLLCGSWLYRLRCCDVGVRTAVVDFVILAISFVDPFPSVPCSFLFAALFFVNHRSPGGRFSWAAFPRGLVQTASVRLVCRQGGR